MIDREKFEEYKKELIKEYIEEDMEAVSSFSPQEQPNRDRSVCAAFLRCLGLDFSAEELVPIPEKDSPGDVIFRDARFEISVVYDEGRRPHAEAKESLMFSKQMETPENLSISISPWRRTPLAYDEIYKHVTERLAAKIARSPSRYTASKLEKTDALVFVDLSEREFNPDTTIPSCDALLKQGWRSVSFLVLSHASSQVIYATESAPAFLRESVGQTRQKWSPYQGKLLKF